MIDIRTQTTARLDATVRPVRQMTLSDLYRIKQLLALGLIERVVVPGGNPRIQYRRIQGAVPTIRLRTTHR